MDQLAGEGGSLTPERVEAAISKAKNDLVSPQVMRHRARDEKDVLIAKAFAAYEERLRASSAVDFDDLLVHVVRILKEHADVRVSLDRRYRYVLVDEYQDTNLAQYAIVRALWSSIPISASPAIRISRSTAGAGPTWRTSSNSSAITPAAGWSSWSGTTGAPRTS